jgi:hypothetical protein
VSAAHDTPDLHKAVVSQIKRHIAKAVSANVEMNDGS